MHKTRLFIAGAVVATVVATFALTATTTQAAETVLVRGIVKPGGAADSINVYITHIATAADPSKIRGIRTDVNVAKATKYKWINKSGALTKTTVTSNPTPEQEVVIRGTLLDDNRITASWIVQNYREFTIEGTLEGVTLDTGSTDEGYITVNVTSSKMRGITPAKAFKETSLLKKDVRIRVNGQTSITAVGKAKHLDEVTASQQKVRVEGQVLDEASWVSSKLNELN
jgi:hypothetical protein